MNRRTFIVSLLILVVGILLAFWLWPHEQPAPISKATPPMAAPSQPPVTTPVPATTPSAPAVNIPNIPGHPLTSQDKLNINSIVQIFRSPISFWGKVVDQDNQPILGANVLYGAADKYFGNGTDYHGISDEKGLFSITGIHGMGLYVRVSKDGYYQLGDKSMRGFDNGSNEMPTKDNPAIFELRKRGQTEPLIMKGISGKFIKEGIPVQVDLTNGRTFNVTNGDIQVQAWINNADIPRDSNQRYDWRCILTVPGGGLQPRAGQLDFEAPTDGYQPSDEIVMSANADQWRDMMDKSYFVKLGNGDYARIDFSISTGIDTHDFTIVSYLNPTPGHTNLEYDPEQQASR